MYLDKPMQGAHLLQAICRTNRPYANKTHGLIVDYLGIFDDVAKALAFDEKSVQQVITNLEELKDAAARARWRRCLDFFPGVDRTVAGYEGLLPPRTACPTTTTRDAFAADYSVLAQLWEALVPDPSSRPTATTTAGSRRSTSRSSRPAGNGKLLWHALGAKTIELIHENVHVEAVRDDLETLVMDPEVLESLALSGDPRKAKEIEIQIAERLRRHAHDPRFVALGQRLEDLKARFEQGLMTSIEFLKMLLEIAREVVEAEEQVDPVDERQQAKAALSELFQAAQAERHADHRRRAWWTRSTASSRPSASPTGRTPTRASGRSRRRCAGPAQVPAPHGPGPLRQSLRLHPAVLRYVIGDLLSAVARPTPPSAWRSNACRTSGSGTPSYYPFLTSCISESPIPQ